MKIALIVFAAATLLSVCAGAQQMTNYNYNEREAAFSEYTRRILMECRQKRDSGQINGAAALVKCSNGHLSEAWSWYQLGLGDLAPMLLSHRLEVAERVDRGALTEEQGQIELAHVMGELLAKAQERQRQTNVQAAAQANP